MIQVISALFFMAVFGSMLPNQKTEAEMFAEHGNAPADLLRDGSRGFRWMR
jgi:hypothetical protein